MASPIISRVTLSNGSYTLNLSTANAQLANNAWVSASDGINSIYGQIASGGGTVSLTLSNTALVTTVSPTSIAAGTPVLLKAPQMGLTQPLIGESGAQWAGELEVNHSLIDGHDHTTGKGAALNISGAGGVAASSVGQPNGVASLDSGGRLPAAQLPQSVASALSCQGGWNCSGGSYPGSPSNGQFWICTTAGTISGTAYAVGDWLVYVASAWTHVPLSALVSSVNGLTGAVVLTAASVSAVALSALVQSVGSPGSASSVPSESAVRSAIQAALTSGQAVNTIWPVSNAPSNSLGINGDWAIDYVHWLIYGPKSGGAWGSGTSVVGPTGPTGPGATTVVSVSYNAGTGVYTLNVVSGAAFANGSWVYANDGTNSILGQVNSGGGTTALVMTSVTTIGAPTALASGTLLTFAGAPGANGAVGHGCTTVSSISHATQYTVNVADGAAFPNGCWIYANDGTNSIYGQIASGGGTTALVLSNTGLVTAGTPTSLVAGTTLTWMGAQGPAGSGTVSGPVSSTSGHVATWNNGGGTLLADSGVVLGTAATHAAGDFDASGAAAAAQSAAEAASIAASALVTSVGSPGSDSNVPSEKSVRTAISGFGTGNVNGAASSVSGNLPSFSGTTGKQLQDSGLVSANIPTQAAAAAASGNVITSAGSNKTQQDSGVALSSLSTVAVANLGGGAETVGGSASNGSAATAARSDHTHAITAWAHESNHLHGGSDVLTLPDTINVGFDGGSSAIAAGTTRKVYVSFACTINAVTIGHDTSATMQINVLTAAQGSLSGGGSSICGSGTKPNTSAAQESRQTSFTSWSATAIAAGTWLLVNVVSNDNAKETCVAFEVTRT